MILIMMMMMSAALVEYKCRLTGGSRRRRRVDPEPLTGFNLMNSLRIREIQFSAIRMQLKFSEYALVSLFFDWKNQFRHVVNYPYIAPSTVLIFFILIIFGNVSYRKIPTKLQLLNTFIRSHYGCLGLSGAVIRWSWFCLGLACPAPTFLSNPDFDHFTPSSIHFNPKNAAP